MSFDEEVEENSRFLAMELKEKKERRERSWVHGLGLKREETRIKEAAKESPNQIKTRVKICHRQKNPLERIG